MAYTVTQAVLNRLSTQQRTAYKTAKAKEHPELDTKAFDTMADARAHYKSVYGRYPEYMSEFYIEETPADDMVVVVPRKEKLRPLVQ